jgi:hypothetical protein
MSSLFHTTRTHKCIRPLDALALQPKSLYSVHSHLCARPRLADPRNAFADESMAA